MTEALDPAELDAQADLVLVLVDKIRPILAGKIPEVQGAVLADLLAMWLAGHHQGGPEVLRTLLNAHVEHVKRLVPPCVEALTHRRRMN